MIPLKAFRAAHIFLPSKIQEMKVDVSYIDELAVLAVYDIHHMRDQHWHMKQYTVEILPSGTIISNTYHAGQLLLTKLPPYSHLLLLQRAFLS